MNRILFDRSEIHDARVTFDGTRAEHVINVLHGSVGQSLKTGVINGLIGTSVIESIEVLPKDPATGLLQGRITVSCNHDTEPVAPWVDLILAPPRPRAMKRLLPQLVQMGVGRIILVGAEKVEKAFWGAQLLKDEVNRPLMIDGLMQAGTTALPEIRIEKSMRHYFEKGRFEKDFEGMGVRVIAHPYGASFINVREMQEKIASGGNALTQRVVAAIGPEGGWTDEEVAMLEDRGFMRMSLGPRILRTDTAAIALLARLMQ